MGTVARVSKTSIALLSRHSLVEKLTGKQGTHCIGARYGAKTRGTQGRETLQGKEGKDKTVISWLTTACA